MKEVRDFTPMLFIDEGVESQSLVETLLTAGENLRIIALTPDNIDPTDPVVLPTLYDENGIFEGFVNISR